MKIPNKTFEIGDDEPKFSSELLVYDSLGQFAMKWCTGDGMDPYDIVISEIYEFRVTDKATVEIRLIERTTEAVIGTEAVSEVLGGVVIEESFDTQLRLPRSSESFRQMMKPRLHEQMLKLRQNTQWHQDSSGFLSRCLFYNTSAESKNEDGECMPRVIRESNPKITLTSWK